MAIATASRCPSILDPTPGRSLMVHGAGTTIGSAAVQMALRREGVRVVAATGDTYARLREFGAEVTPYGDDMGERVRSTIGDASDPILDAGPTSGILPDLVRIAGGDARRIVTVSNHGPAAKTLGVHTSFEGTLGYPALPEFAALAAQGRVTTQLPARFD